MKGTTCSFPTTYFLKAERIYPNLLQAFAEKTIVSAFTKIFSEFFCLETLLPRE